MIRQVNLHVMCQHNKFHSHFFHLWTMLKKWIVQETKIHNKEAMMPRQDNLHITSCASTTTVISLLFSGRSFILHFSTPRNLARVFFCCVLLHVFRGVALGLYWKVVKPRLNYYRTNRWIDTPLGISKPMAISIIQLHFPNLRAPCH